MSIYGFCPTCLGPGVTRERRPNGYTSCAAGHRWRTDGTGSGLTTTLRPNYTEVVQERDETRREIERLRQGILALAAHLNEATQNGTSIPQYTLVTMLQKLVRET